MSNVLNEASLLKSQPARASKSLALSILAALTSLILWGVLCRHLSTEWRYNDQYGYGWFVPFFAAYLFWLRWEDRPPAQPEIPNPKLQTPHSWIAILIAITSLLLLLPIRLFEIPNPAWRALAWMHAGAVATLTLLAIWIAGGKRWVRHFAFPVGFFFVAVPWFSGVEEPLVQGLMRVVASIDAEVLNLLGIPAQVEGNVIRTNAGLVGVNEACSGVRSLQTSLMIGLLFGELKRLSILRRVALVFAAIAIAFVANVLRALFLVWMAASRGLNAMGQSHDVAGYVVLLAVFIGTLAIAAWLGKRKTVAAGVSPALNLASQPTRLPLQLPNFYFLVSAFLWLVAVEVGVESWYRFHERHSVPQLQWTVRWPQSAAGFREIRLTDEMKHLLRCDVGQAAVWQGDRSDKANVSQSTGANNYLLYFFRWRPGHDSALLANFHRPEVCLPSTGWHEIADHGIRYYPIASGPALPFRHFEFSHRSASGPEEVAHVFYSLWQDRIGRRGGLDRQGENASQGLSEWNRAERMRVVLEGTRNSGQQVIEMIMASSQPITGADAEARFGSILPNLVTVQQ